MIDWLSEYWIPSLFVFMVLAITSVTYIYDCVWWANYSKEHHCEAVSHRYETVITQIDVGFDTKIGDTLIHQPIYVPQTDIVDHVVFSCDGGERVER